MYRYIRQRLEALEGLQGKVFPVTAMIDNVDGAFAVYTGVPPTAVRDMEGRFHHFRERFAVDFIGPFYDQLRGLYEAAYGLLDDYDVQTDYGKYIFSAECSGTELEQFDPDAGLYRVPMQVDIKWAPVDA